MTDGGEFDARPVRAFLPGPDLQLDASVWPASIPAVAQLLREGLELPAGLTVLVGENGSGKSTVVEALAEAYGLNPQGNSAHGRTFRVRPSEPGIGGELTVVRACGRAGRLPARRHNEPALHLPGGTPGPTAGAAA